MPRGRTPRQPTRTGRQEGVRNGKASSVRSSGEALAAAPKGRKKTGTPAYNPLAPDRIAEILKRLDQMYPEVTCALTHSSAWELLVATILSAQSTDANVNRVTPELFRKYPTVQAFAALTPEQLQPDVRSTGFFRNKSKSVVGAAKKIVADMKAKSPMTWKSSHSSWRRTQDSQRRAGHVVQESRRRGRRYSCPPHLAAPGADHEQ